ncbi:outer membrane protein assembly factor BamD [Pedobacter sp. P351]|uniref:outer membrane protein assembly factor BamD n=1 Tax=Pedobacter superstes TaxID=3133441 RepID=UPI0030ABAD76
MFKNKQFLTYCLILLITVFAGCKSKFEKLQESTNTAKKYQEALRLYNKGDYNKALILFDDLMQRYRGTKDAEELSYYFAYTNYKLKDYATARYQFKVFADTYPTSPKAEESRFISAYCFYLDSPNYTLDQENTIRAIEALQLFINLYPKSERVTEASTLISNLRDKLEKKSYANAKLYYDIGDFKSAVVAFKNSLRDYPDTKYAEEMEYLTIKAQQQYAKNSLETRQEERFNEVVTYAGEFEEDYPNSAYLKEVQTIKKNSEQSIVAVKKTLATMMAPRDQEKQADTTQKN